MTTIPVVVAYAATIVALLHVVYSDLVLYKIRNWSVLVILAAWLVVRVADGFAHLPGDLLVGGIVFALAFAFWAFRLIGAGDAKLLGACALTIGYDDAFLFSLLLLAMSAIFIVAVRTLSTIPQLPLVVSARLIEIAGTRRIPYGVPIALATLTITGLRLGRLLGL